MSLRRYRRERLHRAALRELPRAVRSSLRELAGMAVGFVAASGFAGGALRLEALAYASTNVRSLACASCGATVVGAEPLTVSACLAFFATHGEIHGGRPPAGVGVRLEGDDELHTMPMEQVVTIADVARGIFARAMVERAAAWRPRLYEPPEEKPN